MIHAETRLPVSPRSDEALTLTGTSTRNAPSASPPARLIARRSPPLTMASTTSLSVPPSRLLISFTSLEVEAHPLDPTMRADRPIVRTVADAFDTGAQHFEDPGETRAELGAAAGDGAGQALHQTPRIRGAAAERVGEQAGGARRRRRRPRHGPADARDGTRVEQRGQDVHAGDAVDQAMVDLDQHREATLRESFDEGRLPERTAAIEGTLEQPGDQRLQLRVGARRRQVAVADVIVEVEILVVDPHRLVQARREVEALPIARDQVQARGDVIPDAREVDSAVGVADRARIEDRGERHVHVRARRLEVQEGLIQSGEPGIAGVVRTHADERATDMPSANRRAAGASSIATDVAGGTDLPRD